MNIEYLAGFFDGEGSISITSNSDNQGFSLRVQITNTNLEILQIIKEQFGGYLLHRGKPNRLDIYNLALSSKMAASFLKTLLPYLRIKKAQAILALELQEIIDKRSKGPDRLGLTEAEISIRRNIKLEMQRLNGRYS